ncbi:hypothetical protein QJS04_geneDACA012668 [Acorus gramineus]|uniref:Endoplasmic reticulum transmembrane protein n=1 Tax=Acorus gramineus TaxID=55184 RepID=A0AAV9B5F9_ACOGR|nr:hypothetical protein QJS04_geneDACA012668 [Acorus gramineus]
MLQLLFLVLFAEGAAAFLLMVKIGPLREMVMRALDQLKMGRGPSMVIVKTLACTAAAIFMSSIFSIVKIQNKGAKLGTVTPMDQVIWGTQLLDASLLGFILYLGFVIDRMHRYLRKLTGLKETVSSSRKEVEELQKENRIFKEKEDKNSREMRVLQEEASNLTQKLQRLKSELEEKEKRAVSAEAHVASLQKQSEDLLLEYDRLLEDNQVLQAQALSFRG